MKTTVRSATIIAVAAILTILVWLPAYHSLGIDQSEAGLKRAAGTYAVARGLNAVISVVQGTELAVEPMGFGAVLAVGQVLDPVNDLVEQFSSVMLLASVAFGLQVILVKMGEHWVLCAAFTVCAWAYALLSLRQGAPRWLGRLLFAIAVVEFAVPMSFLASEGAYRLFLQSQYQAAEQGLEHSSSELQMTEREISSPPANASVEKPGWLSAERWKDVFKGITLPKPPDIQGIAAKVKAAAEASVRHMVDLAAIFLVQTVAFPLAFLWLIVFITRDVLSAPARRGAARD